MYAMWGECVMETRLDCEDILFSVDHFRFLYKLVAKEQDLGEQWNISDSTE